MEPQEHIGQPIEIVNPDYPYPEDPTRSQTATLPPQQQTQQQQQPAQQQQTQQQQPTPPTFNPLVPPAGASVDDIADLMDGKISMQQLHEQVAARQQGQQQQPAQQQQTQQQQPAQQQQTQQQQQPAPDAAKLLADRTAELNKIDSKDYTADADALMAQINLPDRDAIADKNPDMTRDEVDKRYNEVERKAKQEVDAIIRHQRTVAREKVLIKQFDNLDPSSQNYNKDLADAINKGYKEFSRPTVVDIAGSPKTVSANSELKFNQFANDLWQKGVEYGKSLNTQQQAQQAEQQQATQAAAATTAEGRHSVSHNQPAANAEAGADAASVFDMVKQRTR